MVGAAAVQTLGPAGVLLAYLFYEFHFGRVAKLQEQLASFSGAIIALARNVDGVDEDAVIQTMPADVARPERLIDSDEVDEETMDRLEQLISDELDKVNNNHTEADDERA
jgi:hypothetical protein